MQTRRRSLCARYYRCLIDGFKMFGTCDNKDYNIVKIKLVPDKYEVQ